MLTKFKHKVHNRERIEGAPGKVTGRQLYNKVKIKGIMSFN